MTQHERNAMSRRRAVAAAFAGMALTVPVAIGATVVVPALASPATGPSTNVSGALTRTTNTALFPSERTPVSVTFDSPTARTVFFQEYVANRWVDLFRGRTDKTGVAKFTAQAPRLTTLQRKYRVYAPAFTARGATTPAAYSDTLTLSAIEQSTSASAPATIATGTRNFMTADAARPKRNVQLQRRVGNGVWIRLVTVKSDATTGISSLPIPANKDDSFVLRAKFNPASGTAPSFSDVFLVKIGNGGSHATDTDVDGLLDADEAAAGTTVGNPDTDGDGVTDGDEVNFYKSNPLDTDTDGDGISDGDEVTVYRSSPTKTNSDKDPVGDFEEVQRGLNPRGTDLDYDKDSLYDREEIYFQTNPRKTDSDRDGVDDPTEIYVNLTDPTDPYNGAEPPPTGNPTTEPTGGSTGGSTGGTGTGGTGSGSGGNGISSWSSFSAGSTSTCAIATGGSLWCWGRNAYGQIGDGTTTQRLTPTRVGTDADWRSVSVGGAHACAIKTSGGLYCWGSNSYGQLGSSPNGSNGITSATAPVRVDSAGDWSSVGTGDLHTCALKTSGALYCWGENTFGQVGNNDHSAQRAPVLAPTRIGVPGANLDTTAWSSLSVGTKHTCAIRSDSSLYCWGYDQMGQVGDGIDDDDDGYDDSRGIDHPHKVKNNDGGWYAVSAGLNHTCGIKKDATMWCWGDNRAGQLGVGELDNPNTQAGSTSGSTTGAAASQPTAPGIPNTRAVPIQVNADKVWVKLDAGAFGTCALRKAGSLWCWGADGYGELGLNPQSYPNAIVSFPTQVGTDVDWVAVSVGQYHSCAAKTTGALSCTGANTFGQLGDGTTTDRSSFTRIAG